MDQYGFNMVEYGKFIRKFFLKLKGANVTPLVVYNGGRLSEQQFGPLCSKANFLDRSSHVRMMLLARNGSRLDHRIFPELACNAIKQIINELDLEHHPVQSVYEVYPKLAELAEQNDCPVLTSHSDFILTNVRNGFILAEELNQINSSIEREIPIAHVYHNRLLLSQFQLERHGEALTSLYTLLRPDFSGTYYQELNRFFSFLSQGEQFRYDPAKFVPGFRPPRGQQMKRRLQSIFQNWPKHLVSSEDVKTELISQVGGRSAMLRDYDAIHSSFTKRLDFEQAAPIPAHLMRQVTNALTRNESSTTFLLDTLMNQTNFNRGTVEDVNIFRSTFSISDPVRKHLLDLAPRKWNELLDRQFSHLSKRVLAADGSFPADLVNEKVIYELFHFPSQVSSVSQMRTFIPGLRINKALSLAGWEQLLVLLLLARFGLRLAFSSSYDVSKGSKENLTPAVQAKSDVSPYSDRNRRRFFCAIYNCFIYYCYINKMYLEMQNLETHESLIDDANDKSVLPKIRIAANEVTSNRMKQPSITDSSYIEIKHMLEALNYSIHAYSEITSLYPDLTAKLKYTKFYDATLIFKMLRHLMAKNEHNLIEIEPDLEALIMSH